MDADPAASPSDVGLEGRLLVGVQDVAGGVEEDDGPVGAEVLRGEEGGVLGGVDGEPVGRSQTPDQSDAVGDRIVTEAGGLGEDQDAEALSGDRGRRDERESQEEDEEEKS
jgi:hypothetical protein